MSDVSANAGSIEMGTVTENNASETFAGDSLFSEETVSEAELRGEVDEKADESTGDDNSTADKSGDTADPKADANTDEAEKSEETDSTKTDTDSTAGKGDTAKGDNKPPKGYVPNEAIREERAKRKEAQERVKELEKQLSERSAFIENPKAAQNPETDEAYLESEEVKSFADKYPQYKTYLLEKSKDGQILRDKLESYGEDEGYAFAKTIAVDRSLNQQRNSVEQSQAKTYVNSVVHEMDKLFDGGIAGEEAGKFCAYLNDNGVSPDTITLMTSPNTVITDPRTGKSAMLGSKALELVCVLREGYLSAKHESPEALRTQIKAELEKEVYESVTKKMKGASGSTGFQDIGNAPGHETVKLTSIPKTEKDFTKLSEAQQEALLRGDFDM